MATNKNNGLQLIESLETGEQRVYNSVFVDHKNVNILSNDLAIKIVAKLAESKGCAMDLSRDLNQHEQKIYYYLRKLETAGVVKKVGTERRFGMTAKMYSAVSPIVATKLYDDGHLMKADGKANVFAASLFYPFVNNGKMESKIVIGDTYSHGRFDTQSSEGNYAFDLALLLGGLVRDPKFPNYKLDTEMTETDLKNNLILIGSAKTNTIIDKLNAQLPLYFDETKDFCVASKVLGKTYDDPRVGIVLKVNNPFDNTKKILLLGGKTRGTRAAILACTVHIKDLLDKTDKEGNIMCLVKGYDKDGDKVIDEVKFVE